MLCHKKSAKISKIDKFLKAIANWANFWYPIKLFKVADQDFEDRFLKIKMADLKWRISNLRNGDLCCFKHIERRFMLFLVLSSKSFGRHSYHNFEVIFLIIKIAGSKWWIPNHKIGNKCYFKHLNVLHYKFLGSVITILRPDFQ